MNPLALSGPRFLIFYALFAVAVLLLLDLFAASARAGRSPSSIPRIRICSLASAVGPPRSSGVCTVGLVDRGLLKVTGGTADTVLNHAPAFGAPRIERKVLDHFRGGASLSLVVQSKDLLAAASTEYEHRLRSVGLLPNAEAQWMRRVLFALAIAALAGIGGAKIYIALSSGRTNVVFLDRADGRCDCAHGGPSGIPTAPVWETTIWRACAACSATCASAAPPCSRAGRTNDSVVGSRRCSELPCCRPPRSRRSPMSGRVRRRAAVPPAAGGGGSGSCGRRGGGCGGCGS